MLLASQPPAEYPAVDFGVTCDLLGVSAPEMCVPNPGCDVDCSWSSMTKLQPDLDLNADMALVDIDIDWCKELADFNWDWTV